MANWVIRVYVGNKVVDKWIIENRTERQAQKEVEAELDKDTNLQAQEGFDWTMTKKRKALKKVI